MRAQERKPSTVPLQSPSGIIPLVDCHGLSEVGRRREANEDDFLMVALPMDRNLWRDQDPGHQHLVPSPDQTGFLFLVADGVGGVPCGERASSIAVRSLFHYLRDQSPLLGRGSLEMARTMRRGVTQCHSDLQSEVERHPECAGMSTTLTGLLVLENQLHIVHSGDSRGYRLRAGSLSLLTYDHSEAQISLDAGMEEVSRTTPRGNHLWNFLASDYSERRPDVESMPIEPGDTLLLCTDGISDALAPDEIQSQLSGPDSAEDICKSLLAAARHRARGDDLTVIVLRFGRPAPA